MSIESERFITRIPSMIVEAHGIVGGEVEAVLVNAKGSWIPYVLVLKAVDVVIETPVKFDYGWVRLVREPLSLENIRKKIVDLYSGAPIEIDGKMLQAAQPSQEWFVPSDEEWSSFRSTYPTNMFTTTTMAQGSPMTPISSGDSPYFENINYATYDFLEMKGTRYNGGYPQTSIMIPTYVAKIANASIEGKVLSVRIDRHKTLRPTLLLKVNLTDRSTGDYVFGGSLPLAPEDVSVSLELREEINHVAIFLTNAEGELVDRCTGYFASAAPQKVKWVTAGKSLDALIEAGENETVEFKAVVKKEGRVIPALQKEFLESVCGFSNRKGGVIFLGVSDDKEIMGDDSDSVESLEMMIRRWLVPRVDVAIDETNREGKRICIVRIPEGSNKPYAMLDVTNGKDSYFYIRSSSSDVLMSRTDLDEMYATRSGGIDQPWSGVR